MSWPVGRTIVGYHNMTKEEEKIVGWSEEDFSHTEMTGVLVLDDGSWITPSADPEGNHGGCFFAHIGIPQTDPPKYLPDDCFQIVYNLEESGGA